MEKEMSKRTARADLEQLLLVVFVASGAVGFALTYRSRVAWLFVAPLVLSIFRQLERVPPRMARAARYAAWAAAGAAALMVRFFPTNQVFSSQTQTAVEAAVGYLLLILSSLFLLGTRIWSPPSTLFPATLALLALVAMNSAFGLRSLVATSASAVFLYLLLTATTRPEEKAGSPYGRRQLSRLAVVGLAVFLITWAIIEILPRMQGTVEQAAFRFFNMGTTQYSSLSLDSRLGDIEQLLLSQKVVMRVWAPRAQKLRGRVFTQFDGEVWRARPLAGTPLLSTPAESIPSPSLREWLEAIPGSIYKIPDEESEAAAGPHAIRTKILQSVFNGGMLVSPGGNLLVRAPVTSLRLDAFGGLGTQMSSAVEIYGVVNRRNGDIVQPGEASPQVLQESLALSQDTDARLRELAARLAGESPSAQERVQRTVDYVRSACRYSLNVGRFRSQQPVAEFLFEKKQGYCQYFASAAAVLLRLERVPARYVTGFEVREDNRAGGHYVVRELDAHAWIEAYVPRRGWIEADPTPEDEYASLHAHSRAGWLGSAVEWLQSELAEMYSRVSGGDFLAAFRWLWGQIKALWGILFTKQFGLAVLLAALLPLVLRALRRRARKAFSRLAIAARQIEADEASPELIELLARVDGVWARRGFPRPVSRAPLEHLAGIPPEKTSPALRAASQKAVECFYRASFGGMRMDATEVRALHDALEQAGASSRIRGSTG